MKKILVNIGILTYAIWGTLLLVGIEYVLANRKTPLLTGPEKPDTTFLLLIHIILLLASAYPIFILKKHIGQKVLLIIVHYFFVVIFAFYIYYLGLVGIFGWNN
jgi:hypothetical protein